MNLLFLTQIIPYPPDSGPKVKTWHVLRYLSGLGHNVILASFVRPDEESNVDGLRQVCSSIYTIPIHRSRLADVGYWMRSNITGRPFLIERDDLIAMRKLVRHLVVERSIDVIHADQLTMTQFAMPYYPEIKGNRKVEGNREDAITMDREWPMLIFDAHNASWTIVERMTKNAPLILKRVMSLEANRIKNYEASAIEQFDHTLTVAAPDRVALINALSDFGKLGAGNQEKIHVIPIAVDTAQLRPVTRRPGSLNIVTLGTLHYPPNADGIRWFLNDVFPLIRRQVPGTTLTIIGKNPPSDFILAAEKTPQSIKVTGYVPDLVPYMEDAALMVVPVRAGGGMRVRILEAFARAMPVATTTVGLEGIDAQPGRDVLVADGPDELAASIIELLEDAGLQACLATNGRKLVEERYDWQVVLKKLDQIYGNIDAENKEH